MNALQLSLTSYGFTQEQVGMQMNTLQRRVTALKQALINLTTSTNGSVSTVLKGLVNTLVSLLQHLNNIPVQQLGFTILMNVIALKGPAIINILNRMKNSVLGVGQAFNSLSKMGKANVFVAVATVIYDACSALGMFDTATTKAGKELDKLNQKIEVQTELVARQEQGLQSLDTLAEAWRTINEELAQYNEGSSEYQKLADEKNQVEQTFIDLLGEEDEQTLINEGVSEEAIANIKQKKQDQINAGKVGIAELQKASAEKSRRLIKQAHDEADAIRNETNGTLGLSWALLKQGDYIDALSVAARRFSQAFQKASVTVLDYIIKMNDAWNESFIGKLANKTGMAVISTASSSILHSLRDTIQAGYNSNEAVINDIKSSDADSVLADALEKVKNLQGNVGGRSGTGNDDIGRQLITDPMGGSEVDDSGSGKSKKGKKDKIPHEGKPSYDGIELKEVNEDNYRDYTDSVGELTPDTIAKLRALDEAVYTKFGEHVNVTSSYRPNDTNSNHGHKVAFDLAGGVMDDPDKRYWIEHLGPYLGLFVIPEYPGEAGEEYAKGGPNVHFSDVTPGIYGETRWAEGLWSEDNTAPTLGTILGKGIDSGKTQYVDNSVQRQVYDLLYSKLGLTDKQAWAAMANIDGESSFDPAAEEHPGSSSGGIGLMSWTADRRDNLLEFAKQRRTDWRDLKTQLAFIEYEYNGSEAEPWQRFKDFVTDQTTPEQEVEYFAGPLGPERAGDINLANRMKNYYEYDSHYAKGMSFYDSNPSKQKEKEITPEERAEKEAQRLQQMFGTIDKSLDLLSKSFSGKFKTILESIQEDQKYFGSNIDNTTKQLDTYSQQLKSVVYMQNQYQQAITKVSTFLDDKGVKAVLGVSKDKFLAADLSEQQKMMSKQATGTKLYQPTIVALNEILKLKQSIQKQDEEYHKVQLQWVDTYRKRTKALYEDTIWSEQESIKEWEIRHSNEKYDDWHKYFAEQDHLEAIARQYREEYEEAQKPLLDENGHQVYDSEGNPLNRIENDPKKLEELREKWLSAEEAAKKYSATLKNSVQDSFHDLTKSVLLEGGSLRDKLKELWKGLADDALSLLLSGGKSGTNSPLGNLLRMFVLRHQQHNVKFYDKQHFDYGSQAMWDTSAEQFGAYNFKPQRNYWRQFMGQAKYLYYNPMPVDLVSAATKFDGKPFNPLNPVPVTIVNGGPLQDALTDIPNTLTNQPTTPSSGAFDYGQLGSFNGGIVGQKPSNPFANATRYNWLGQFANYGSGGWGVIPIGQKLGMFANGLPWLFSLFGHHAEGGEVDKEQISYLAEGNKKEYVIPTQVSVPLRGLWFLSAPVPRRIVERVMGSFRPLAGIMVLISCGVLAVTSSKPCFRPLAGIMVLICFFDFLLCPPFESSFRPLAGIMVLIRTLYKCLYEAVEMAFCGADHIFSSFFVFCRKMIFKKLLRTEF